VYRIVQEALTNATKHAPGAPVHVHLTWTREHLEVKVVNDAPAAGTPRGSGTGHGLIGMRERAVAAGGRLQTGRTDSWGYEVRASLPTQPPTVAALDDRGES
jgi:signal transduction histidine kinase